jgi:uncharacterized protein YjbJ (UPF0337 family)
MKSSTQDKVEGKIHKNKGEIKEIAGKHINNPDLEREGKDEKIIGKEDLPNNHVLMSGKEKAKTKR